MGARIMIAIMPMKPPGRSRLFEQFQAERDSGALAASVAGAESLASAFQRSGGIGTPAEFRQHVRSFEEAGIDQIILLQQAGRNKHAEICASLELLAREVLGEFAAKSATRERRKAEDLAPFIEKALARKQRMPALGDADIPVVRASVAKPVVNQSAG